MVELTIALALMALVVAAIAPSLYAAFRSSSTMNSREEANSLAIEATESLRSLPYYEVGYSATNPKPSSCTGQYPVTVATSGLTSAVLPSTQTVGHQTFTVVACAYWASAGDGSYPGAYKETVVTVTWHDEVSQTNANGFNTVVETSALYPGGQTAYMACANFDPGTTATTIACPVPTTSSSTSTSSSSTSTTSSSTSTTSTTVASTTTTTTATTTTLPAPTVTSINPSSIKKSQTTTLTISGTNFVATPTVTISGGGGSATVTSFSSTTLTVQVTAGSTTGTYNVTVTNPSGQSVTVTGGLTVKN
ncbi:MAG TPA: IPT/TIG domain-containing protein [Acidimicrobiales bacterium]|nr:IPT/TIG domain-containing protein [Acidimicrobiales bacterium]